jgi:hypothetical protein
MSAAIAERRRRLDELVQAARDRYPTLGVTFHEVLARMWMATGGGPS